MVIVAEKEDGCMAWRPPALAARARGLPMHAAAAPSDSSRRPNPNPVGARGAQASATLLPIRCYRKMGWSHAGFNRRHVAGFRARRNLKCQKSVLL